MLAFLRPLANTELATFLGAMRAHAKAMPAPTYAPENVLGLLLGMELDDVGTLVHKLSTDGAAQALVRETGKGCGYASDWLDNTLEAMRSFRRRVCKSASREAGVDSLEACQEMSSCIDFALDVGRRNWSNMNGKSREGVKAVPIGTYAREGGDLDDCIYEFNGRPVRLRVCASEQSADTRRLPPPTHARAILLPAAPTHTHTHTLAGSSACTCEQSADTHRLPLPTHARLSIQARHLYMGAVAIVCRC